MSLSEAMLLLAPLFVGTLLITIAGIVQLCRSVRGDSRASLRVGYASTTIGLWSATGLLSGIAPPWAIPSALFGWLAVLGLVATTAAFLTRNAGALFLVLVGMIEGGHAR